MGPCHLPSSSKIPYPSAFHSISIFIGNLFQDLVVYILDLLLTIFSSFHSNFFFLAPFLSFHNSLIFGNLRAQLIWIVIFAVIPWGRSLIKLEGSFVLYCIIFYWSCFSQCTSEYLKFSFFFSSFWLEREKKTCKKNSRRLLWLSWFSRLVVSLLSWVQDLLDLKVFLGHILRYFTGPDFPSVIEHSICL